MYLVFSLLISYNTTSLNIRRIIYICYLSALFYVNKNKNALNFRQLFKLTVYILLFATKLSKNFQVTTEIELNNVPIKYNKRM